MTQDNRFIAIENFNEALKYCATLCAQQPFNMTALWTEFFHYLAENWRAHIEIEIPEVISILDGAAYHSGLYHDYDFHQLRTLRDYGIPRMDVPFWYKLPDDLCNIPQGVQFMARVYMVTIAIFETINYRCWYDCNVGVKFNRTLFLETMKYGKININWSQYLIENSTSVALTEIINSVISHESIMPIKETKKGLFRMFFA